MKAVHLAISAVEASVFQTLLAFRDSRKISTQFRVAGGWVRDKLLGKQSDDIDIALDDMTGQKCALLLKDYLLQSKGQCVGFGVIKLNPQKSKHLETATIKINDIWIDLVNLRSQNYEEDSRIPEIQIGTPMQDALRRDFTINALFYNINSGEVQDWTGMGLSDLKDQIIRTPLKADKTFQDDPLRVLRAIRFASRLNFKLHQQIEQAMDNQEIHRSLRKKISKQRIHSELFGMLRNVNSLRAVGILVEKKLWSCVFQMPGGYQISDQLNLEMAKRGFKIFQNYLLLKKKQISPQTTLACLLKPYLQFKVTLKKKNQVSLSVHLMRELKCSGEELRVTSQIMQGSQRIKQSSLKGAFGFNIRTLRLLKQLQQFVYQSYLLYLAEGNPQNDFIQVVQNQHLLEFHRRRPLLDGNRVIELLGVKGSQVRVVLENVLLLGTLRKVDSKEAMQEMLMKQRQIFQIEHQDIQ